MNKPVILVLAEKEDTNLSSLTLELLNHGGELSKAADAELEAALIGCDDAGMDQELTRYARRVYALDHPLLNTFQVEIAAVALEQLCRQVKPDVILGGHTPDSAELVTRLSCRLNTRLITDCLKITGGAADGRLLFTKPVYGGNAIATFTNPGNPQMATLRPKSTGPANASPAAGEIVHFEPVLDAATTTVHTLETVVTESVSLAEAEVVVSGGRGIGKVEGIIVLEHLIAALKKHVARTELGASRPLIDAKWLPSSRQVGLTGEKVSPQVYFAVGISGASQHMAGIAGAKKIVAINRDKRAPIFNYADYGIVGDYQEVLPALIEKLSEVAGETIK